MAWTTPKTFTPVALSSSELNTYLSGNTQYLYDNIPVTLLTTRGDLLYRNATVPARLAIGAAGRYLRSDGTDPSWAAPLWSDLTYSGLTAGQVPRATSSTAVAFGALDLANTNAVTGVLPTARGGVPSGTSFPGSPAANDLYYRTDQRRLYVYESSIWKPIGGQGVFARVYRTTNQSIANTTNTVVLFDAERQDTDALHSTSVNTGRLTAPYSGFYLISCTVAFDTSAVGTRQVQLEVNGSTTIQVTNATPAGYVYTSVTALYYMAATDYVQAIVYQSSGGDLNVLAVGNYSAEFAMQLVAIA